MKKLTIIQHQYYQKLQKQVEDVQEEKIMIWVMLSLERLWQPFLFSTRHLGSVVQTPIREIMDAVWQKHSIFEDSKINTNNFFDKDKVDYYKSLLEGIGGKIEEEEGSEDDHYESYLMDALYSGFKWFFPTVTSTTSSIRWDLTLIPVDFITDWLLDTYLPMGEEEEAMLYQESSWIQDELGRIQLDLTEVVESEEYDSLQKKRDHLLTLKKKYQDLWIISPPSSLDK